MRLESLPDLPFLGLVATVGLEEPEIGSNDMKIWGLCNHLIIPSDRDAKAI